MRPGEPPAAADVQDRVTFVPREPKLRTQLRGPRARLSASAGALQSRQQPLAEAACYACPEGCTEGRGTLQSSQAENQLALLCCCLFVAREICQTQAPGFRLVLIRNPEQRGCLSFGH